MNCVAARAYNNCMKILTSFVVLIAAVIFLACGCQQKGAFLSSDLLDTVQQRGHLIVGVKFDSPPFGFMDAQGQLKGFEIDLARELAQRILGKSEAVEFVQVNSSTRVAALNAGQVDFVLATMTITPQRSQVVNFTQPYFQAAQAIVVRGKSPITHITDLKDKRINYVIGTTGETNLRSMFPQAKLSGFKSSTEAFTAFYANRADAFSTDDSILKGFMAEYPGLRLLPERISVEPYGIAFQKDPESQSLQDKVQDALDAISAEGKLDALMQRWHLTPDTHS